MRVLFRKDGTLFAAEFIMISAVKSQKSGMYDVKGVIVDNTEPIVIKQFDSLFEAESCVIDIIENPEYYNISY